MRARSLSRVFGSYAPAYVAPCPPKSIPVPPPRARPQNPLSTTPTPPPKLNYTFHVGGGWG